MDILFPKDNEPLRLCNFIIRAMNASMSTPSSDIDVLDPSSSTPTAISLDGSDPHQHPHHHHQHHHQPHEHQQHHSSHFGRQLTSTEDDGVGALGALGDLVGGLAGMGDDGEEVDDDPRTVALKHYAYGVALPVICSLGIVGNILNLVVLTRRNMKGIAYIYMRGYSAASLLAIAFAIPFGLRVLIHRESGGWTSLPQAFYHAHLELFLGNACLGVGVMMLLALTVERYASVCRPGRRSPPPPLAAPPHRARAAAFLIPVITFILYLPNVFRAQLTRCLTDKGTLIYQKRDNAKFLHSLFFSVYKCALELMFKIAPTLLLAGLNLRIMVVYRRSCERRRQMTLKPSGEESRKFAEEQRLVLLLGSTSILFFVCVSPMAILNVTLSERNLNFYSYQVFRAIANVLEVTNYSITFYIYCLFSEDFRNTLIRTFRCPADSNAAVGSKSALPAPRSKASAGKGNGGTCGGRGGAGAMPVSGAAAVPTTTTTTTTATAGTVMAAGENGGIGASSSMEERTEGTEGWRAISGAFQKARVAWSCLRTCGCSNDSACAKEASPGGSSADRVIV